MQLSESQKQAVEYLESPQIILAGAGSGKTRVIVAKARYLTEQNGYKPESVLVITYSQKTQAELEERLAELGDNAPEVMTFHSFGLDILNEFSNLLGFSGEVVKADEYTLYRHLLKAVAELPDSRLLRGNNPESSYNDLKGFIGRAKDELVTPSELISRAQDELRKLPSESDANDDETILARDRWSKIYEASRIYQSYERIKGESSTSLEIDYNDMILLSHMLLKTEKIVGATLRKRYKYILVDEFQDANYAQVEMLYHLAGGKIGITVVGDDDQAIYRFRGASFGSFKLFERLFPNAKRYKLEENYRSAGNIVNAAQSLIEIEPEARFDSHKRMIATVIDGDKVAIRICPDFETEAAAVADAIENLLQNELYSRPKSIAVLFRARRHKELLQELLNRRGIEFSYDKKTDETLSSQARLILSIYEFTVDNSRLDSLAFIMRRFTPNLSPSTEREIMYRISRTNTTKLEFLESIAGSLDEESAGRIKKVIELLRHFENLRDKNDPLRLLEIILIRTGLLSSIIRDGKIVDEAELRGIAGILRSAESFVTHNPSGNHGDFLAYREWSGSQNEYNGKENDDRNPVILQTIHGSKGLEYRAVFVIGLSNKRFPAAGRSSSVEFPPELYKDELPEGDYRIQEERRLFYVAMTRAREKLYLFGVEKRGTKRSRFLQELESSPLFEQVSDTVNIERSETEIVSRVSSVNALDEARSVIIPELSGQGISDGLLEVWRQRSAGAKSPDDLKRIKAEFKNEIQSATDGLSDIIEKTVFRNPEAPHKFKVDYISYSDLVSFDTCPLQFYYGKVLRIPSPSNPYMIFGSTIHSTLEAAAVKMMNEEAVDYDDLTADYDKRWSQVALSDPDQKERLGKTGYELLRNFLRAQSELKGKPIELERKFGVKLGDVTLSGRIDRIDRTPEGLEIIDYKSGSMNERKLKGDLQLPIYALACKELYDEFPTRLLYMFLKNNEIYPESFDQESIEAVKSTILSKIDEINSSDFAANPGWQCGNCSYNRICPAAQR